MIQSMFILNQDHNPSLILSLNAMSCLNVGNIQAVDIVGKQIKYIESEHFADTLIQTLISLLC